MKYFLGPGVMLSLESLSFQFYEIFICKNVDYYLSQIEESLSVTIKELGMPYEYPSASMKLL